MEMVVEKVFAQRDVFQAFRAGANIPAGNLINQKEAHALAPMVTGSRLPCQHISCTRPIRDLNGRRFFVEPALRPY